MAYSTHSGIVKPAWRQAWGYFLRRKNGMMHSTISPRQLANENSVISTPNVAPVEVMTMATISTPTMMLLNEAKTYPFCRGSSRPLKGILSETVMAAHLLYLIVVSCSPSEKRQRRGCRLSERDLLPSPLSGK